jgi:transcriptional/translational regulatory protein YebC/TACO1
MDENEIYIYTSFADFGRMTKALEDQGIAILSAEKQRIPNSLVALNESQQDEVIRLVESLEQDDDVQHVYHNLK